MMTKERKEVLQNQITAILDTEGFIEDLTKAASAEDACRVLAKYNIEAEPDEIGELTNDGNEAIKQYGEKTDDELSEEDLAAVAGGSKFWRFLGAVVVGAAGGAVMGLICGVCPAATPACYKIAVGYGIVAGTWISRG